MPDLMQEAIEDASKGQGELARQAKRLNVLREDPAWQELREIVKGSRARVTENLGRKALAGTDAAHLHDEGIYSRGFLDGCQMLLDKPDDVHRRIEALINESLARLRMQAADAAVSPYT